LKSLVDRFGVDLMSSHRWFDERERWVELVHAITARCTKRGEHEIRVACEKLAQDGLLDRPGMICESDVADRVTAVFRRHGLAVEESERAVTALREVSQVIDLKYGGKLQIYLRRWFEGIVQEMLSDFPISVLDADDLRHAFRFWLQNVAGAPLSLTHSDALEYCEAQGVDWDELVAAADAADINLPWLDDMVHAAVGSGSVPVAGNQKP
jgi:hypothetical protein